MTSANVKNAVLLITGGYDHTIRFWDALSGACTKTIQHPDSQINTIVISPDKTLFAVGGHHTIKIFQINSTDNNPLHVLDGHMNNITKLLFQIESKWLASCSEDATLKIWNMRTFELQLSFKTIPMNDMAIHPDQTQIYTCHQNGCLYRFSLTSKSSDYKGEQILQLNDCNMQSITISQNGEYLACGTTRGNCYFWKIDELLSPNRTPYFEFSSHAQYLTKCLFSPDSSLFITCSSDSTVKIWSVLDFSLIRTLTGHQRWVWDAAFSADSAYLVTASSDHTLKLWDVKSGKAIRQYNGHHKAVVSVALNDVSG